MGFGSLLLQEMQVTGFFLIVPTFFIGLAVTHKATYHRGLIYTLMTLHILLLPMTVWAQLSQTKHAHLIEFTCMSLGYAGLIALLTKFIYRTALPRLQINVPRIVEDLFFGAALIVTLFVLVSGTGYNLSALIPTSAVLTGVIGLAMQETLGNFIAGVVLQVDRSIQVGDWIQLGEISGRVSEIRWRYTSIETRNWETIVLPNNVLTQSQVVVLGRRSGCSEQWRRWIYFNVDYRYPPSQVIAAVTDMLRKTTAEIKEVADDPAPNCIMMDFSESYARYAVRYWLTDLALDDPTDSQVRTRLFFALKRANIPVALPAYSLFLKEVKDRKSRRKENREELSERSAMLSKIELFHPLSEEERDYLANKLLFSPYTQGETLTRQGSKGHWLYIIRKGTVKIELDLSNGKRKEIGRLSDGDFFGEMALLTGVPRTSTVTAITEVEAYRLDKGTFHEVVQNQASMADYLAGVLARRETELEKAREEIAQHQLLKIQEKKANILNRISQFFKPD